MFKNPNIFHNFENYTFEHFWNPFENKWTDEAGNGIVKENVSIKKLNVSNNDKENIKNCLVIQANGDLYKKNEPKGLKKNKKKELVKINKSKRVGGGVISKNMFGPGIFEWRLKFNTVKVLNALWLYHYAEHGDDEIPHRKNVKYNIDNKKNTNSILNSEIDLEYPAQITYNLTKKNTIQYNTYVSTEHQELFNETIRKIDNLNDDIWHTIRIEWNTDICPINYIINRDLELDEIIIYNKNCYINNIKNKKYEFLNGTPVIRSMKHDNKFCFYYGKSIKYYIDNMSKSIFEFNVKNKLTSNIPYIKSNVLMGLWFSNVFKEFDFESEYLYIDYFKYIPNEDPYLTV